VARPIPVEAPVTSAEGIPRNLIEVVADLGKDDAERKQVTVLFADVKGSMDLAEQHDPEEWRKIMQRFFSILTDAVERFEGTVDKFTGDGIMAVFGAPIAHEDHGRRACYAALQMLDDVGEYAAELRRAEGLNFSVRIGVNSGEVVAGAIGPGSSQGDYTAIGHTVGLAQRMEALAEPGKVYLTEETAELAAGFLELEDLGEFEIKGASHPIRVFELIGVGRARSRLDLSRERGFSRFVGRSDEMAVFEEAFERAEEGEGGVVALVADPGVGKSRLCLEFAERCRARGIEVYEAQAQSHGKSIPFMPVLQLMRDYFGITDTDPDRIARERVAGRSLLLDPELAPSLPLLFDFLGIPDPARPLPPLSAEARQRALGDVVCRLVNAPERRDTVVVVVEDLHWIDEASSLMLDEMVRSVESTRTLAIVNYRPEYTPSWSESSYRQVPLEPLGEADTLEMLRDLAGEDPSLDGLGELVHERAQGNPFFIEEIVRELAESGYIEGERGSYTLVRPLEDTGVPPTVQAVLAARIDRLGPESKALLQVASVIGKEVGAHELRITAGVEEDELEPLLDELTESGFLYEAELYPEKVLAFRHPLTREVAYGTQLADRREATHAAAAGAIAELNPDRHDELAALIADHMAAGGEPLEAARWYARAAYWTGSSQPAEAMRLWQQVTRFSDELDEGPEAAALALNSRILQLDFAWRLGMDPEEEAKLASAAREMAERTGDLRALALLKMATEARPGLLQDTDTWIAAADEASRLADESGDLHLRVAIHAASAYARLCAGDFDGFESWLDGVLELSGNDPTVGAGIVIGNPVAWAHMGKATVRRERGEYDEAERLLEIAIELSGEIGDPESGSWIRGTQAMLRSTRGDLEGGVALGRRNVELTEQLGDVFSRSLAIANLAVAEIANDDHGAALEAIEEAERLYRGAMGNGGEMEAWRGGIRAEALRGVGRPEEGVEVARRACDVARERGMRWSLPLALLALGRCEAAAGDADAARRALDEGAAVAKSTGAKINLADIEAERDLLLAGTR
jgi:class 3 adenylate cyclase/tetratricopeptide (TPR) repeat protein